MPGVPDALLRGGELTVETLRWTRFCIAAQPGENLADGEKDFFL
jgi:hypothetical protein